jgi:DNA-binding IclR family transcriptional regulator
MAKSALRALQIMQHVAARREGCTHAEIAQALSIPKSSLTALLRDLNSNGYLQQDAGTAVFSIGVQVLALANSYLHGIDIVRLGQEAVRRLFCAVGEFSLLCVASDLEYVLVCSESLPTLAAHTLQIGHRAPLYCSATGRAMLAHMPQATCELILRRSQLRPLTPYTKLDLNAIRADLDVTRRTGLGYAHEEMFVGISAIAAPIINSAGAAVASIAVALPTVMLTPQRTKDVEHCVREAGIGLSRQLGWTGGGEDSVDRRRG